MAQLRTGAQGLLDWPSPSHTVQRPLRPGSPRGPAQPQSKQGRRYGYRTHILPGPVAWYDRAMAYNQGQALLPCPGYKSVLTCFPGQHPPPGTIPLTCWMKTWRGITESLGSPRVSGCGGGKPGVGKARHAAGRAPTPCLYHTTIQTVRCVDQKPPRKGSRAFLPVSRQPHGDHSTSNAPCVQSGLSLFKQGCRQRKVIIFAEGQSAVRYAVQTQQQTT